MSDGDWFAPKRFGYGTGLPISWQGWAVLIAYLAVMIGAARWLLPRERTGAVALMVVATALFLLLCKRHTRGGWKWRAGAD